MAKAREPKVFRSMDDLPLMLTPLNVASTAVGIGTTRLTLACST